MVGALQDFKTYLLLKPGSAFVMVVHSPMKCVTINKETQRLQGWFIGFVGDPSITKDPTPILLPQQKTWCLKTYTISTNNRAMAIFYWEDNLQRGKLWDPQPANDELLGEVTVLLLLSIPLVLFCTMRVEGWQLILHDIYALVMATVEVAPDTSVATVDWSLVLNWCWCLAAAQRNDTG
jgi:hypothetical protein